MKKYMILDSKDSYEYDVVIEPTKDGQKYTLFRSPNPEWDKPGEEILSITDDGDNMVLSIDPKKTMDYAEVAELYLLLSVHNKNDDFMAKYKMIAKEGIDL